MCQGDWAGKLLGLECHSQNVSLLEDSSPIINSETFSVSLKHFSGWKKPGVQEGRDTRAPKTRQRIVLPRPASEAKEGDRN